MAGTLRVTIRITIDLERLRSHLAREDRREVAGVAEAEVLQRLRDAGFRADAGGWIVAEPDLGQLDPFEVINVVAIE